jgi:hypothetical protein
MIRSFYPDPNHVNGQTHPVDFHKILNFFKSYIQRGFFFLNTESEKVTWKRKLFVHFRRVCQKQFSYFTVEVKQKTISYCWLTGLVLAIPENCFEKFLKVATFPSTPPLTTIQHWRLVSLRNGTLKWMAHEILVPSSRIVNCKIIYCIRFKGTLTRDFRPLGFFHQTTPPRPLIHRLKPFWIWLRIRGKKSKSPIFVTAVSMTPLWQQTILS